MSAMAEFGDILPGGEPFEPGKIGQGLANFGIRFTLTGDDPKSRISDVTAIGADVGAAAVVDMI